MNIFAWLIFCLMSTIMTYFVIFDDDGILFGILSEAVIFNCLPAYIILFDNFIYT